MGRNRHKAPTTMTLTAAFESQESSCARLFEKGPLDHEIGDVCGRRRIFDDETSRPLSHYDLVNLTS